MKFNKSWRDFQPKKYIEDPISPANCFFGAAGILAMVLMAIIVIIVLLAEGGYNW